MEAAGDGSPTMPRAAAEAIFKTAPRGERLPPDSRDSALCRDFLQEDMNPVRWLALDFGLSR